MCWRVASGSISTGVSIMTVPQSVFLWAVKHDLSAARRFLLRAIDQYGLPDKITIDKQDHQSIKRIVRLMLELQSFRCARILLTGIETMYMIKKGQLGYSNGQVMPAADHFYSLAT